MMRYFVSILSLTLLTSLSFSENKNQQAAALIDHAKQLSDIRAEGAPAFVLRAEFKILRDPAHPITGSHTEIWASQSLFRTETLAGDFTKIEVINDRKRWELSSASETPKDIGFAASTIAYRLVGLSLDSRGSWKVIDRTSGSWALRCIVGHDDGFGGHEELCFDRASGQFVAQSSAFISQGGGELVSKCAFTDFQKFGIKMFPQTIQCVEGEKQVLVARVVQLAYVEPDKSSFAALPGAKEFPNCPVGLKHAEALEQPEPESRRSGAVVVSLVVGTDGAVKDPKVVTSGGSELDDAALKAVRRWRFKPATCAGNPMEATINVAFNVRGGVQ